MALNKSHTVEELGEEKCSVVEKDCSNERVQFLKQLLEFNGFKVVVVNSPPPKAKPAAKKEEDAPAVEEKRPETFIVGVTDLTFSPMNAIYNRELKTPAGEVITPAFWKQREASPSQKEWYWIK